MGRNLKRGGKKKGVFGKNKCFGLLSAGEAAGYLKQLTFPGPRLNLLDGVGGKNRSGKSVF